jgi:hypothetical protein
MIFLSPRLQLLLMTFISGKRKLDAGKYLPTKRGGGVLGGDRSVTKGLSPRHGRIGVAFGWVGRLRSDDDDVCRGGWYRVNYWKEGKKQLLTRLKGRGFSIGIDAFCDEDVKVSVKVWESDVWSERGRQSELRSMRLLQ